MPLNAAPSPPERSGAPPGSEVTDPDAAKKAELATAFASNWLKGIKQIGMYRHDRSRYGDFLDRAFADLAQFTEGFGPLGLRVDQQNFLFGGQPLLREETRIAYRFYRDGVRTLLFRQGITRDELVRFTLVALSDPERGAEDAVSQLWHEALEHVEYVVAEGFQLDGVEDQQVQVEVEKVVDYLQSRLRSQSNDYLRFARVSAEDLDLKLDGVEQLRGLVITGKTADDTIKAKLQRELGEDEEIRLFPKLVAAIFQVVEGSLDDTELLEEMFSQLLDALLLSDDLATVNHMVLKLRALEAKALRPELSHLLDNFITRMGEEQRVLRVGELLSQVRPKNPLDVTRYLQALKTSALPALLSALETVELPENRTLICDALVPLARENPEAFVSRLESDAPQTVRDMVYILEKSQTPERMKLFAKVLKHRNLAVRLEVLSIIARGRTGESRKLLAEGLKDETEQVRLLSARLLPELDRDLAYKELVVLIKAPDFDKRSAEERQALYAALGSTGLPAVVTLLTELMEVKPNLLNKKRVLEDKLLAVHGLAGVASIQSYNLLKQIVAQPQHPPELLSAARKALHQTKKTLFGDGPAP